MNSLLFNFLQKLCLKYHFSLPTTGTMSFFLIYNAKIWTSKTTEDVSWMVFNKTTGYVTEIGISDPPDSKYSESEKINCDGRRIFPGFHDAHLHLFWFAFSMRELNLYGCKSITELQDRLKEYVTENPDMKWIVGKGLDQDLLGKFPTWQDIDEACSTKPVFLKRICCHVGVANSLALNRIGKSNLLDKIK